MLSRNMRLIMKCLFLPNHSVQCFRSFYQKSFVGKRNIFLNHPTLGYVPTKKYCQHYSTNMSANEGLHLPAILQILTNFAPLSLADSWDNVGLLVKPVTNKIISKVLLTIDLTEDVMQEALDESADMIISYHPPIFASLKRITNKSWKERIVANCLENKIAVYSPHTTWDAVKGGLTDWLASCFDSESVTPLVPIKSLGPTNNSNKFTMSIYCPQQHVEELNSMLRNKSCEGVLSSAQPDNKGIVKFEVACSMDDVNYYMQGMNGCGCVYNVQERMPVPVMDSGMGRLCKLKEPISLSEAVERVKKHVGLSHLRLAPAVGKNKESKVKSIALVAGSGASLLRGVNADLYVTGEMLHHDILDANHNNASVILINHSDSERGFLKEVGPQLEKEFQSKVAVVISIKDRDPLVTV